MAWKIVYVAFMAVGVLAEYQVTPQQRQQFKDMVKEYCTKNGAADKVDQAEAAVTTFIDCGKSLFDPETVKKEIEEAKPNGALDEVFKKYCAKSPQLKACIHALTDGVTPCIEQSFREHVPAINNATEQLLNFVCYNDGDRIALFIAEEGPQCFQSKGNELRECYQKIKNSVPTIEAAKNLTLAEKCAKFDEFSACVVTALETCSSPTASNMADALLRYVRNGSPCKAVAAPK